MQAGESYLGCHIHVERYVKKQKRVKQKKRAKSKASMPPKRDADEGGGGASKKSRLTQKTAAEFFAENKHFAGAM